jgi:hypothetical protein
MWRRGTGRSDVVITSDAIGPQHGKRGLGTLLN